MKQPDGSEVIPESPYYDVMTRRDHDRWMRNNRQSLAHERDLVSVAHDGQRPMSPLERQLGGRFR